MTQKATIGRIVIFVPNGSESHKLPNGMQEAPAMIVQTFENNPHVNLNIFTAEQNVNKSPVIVGWSIEEGSEKTPEGKPYYKWPEIVPKEEGFVIDWAKSHPPIGSKHEGAVVGSEKKPKK